MMKNLVFTLLVLTLTACTTPSADKVESTPAATPVAKDSAKKSEALPGASKKGRECICTRLWMPVCGADKKTYSNACEADCAGVKYTAGACKDKLQDV